MLQQFIREVQVLNFIDIGCRGGVAAKWRPIRKYLNITGFDASREECERLSGLPNRYFSATYLPYAIAGDNRSHTLFVTREPTCTSLLKPNINWLKRLSLGNAFDVITTEQIVTRTLDSIQEIAQIDVDIVKSDTQGLELPILSNARDILKKAFYVEIETVFGSYEGYIGEAPYARTEDLMMSNNFLLFDIVTHRIPRNNILKDSREGEQIYYCETVWLKDYVALHESNQLDKEHVERKKALKSLILCAAQGCISYGYELATLYKNLGTISSEELKCLASRKNWLLESRKNWLIDSIEENNLVKQLAKEGINYSLRLFKGRR